MGVELIAAKINFEWRHEERRLDVATPIGSDTSSASEFSVRQHTSSSEFLRETRSASGPGADS